MATRKKAAKKQATPDGPGKGGLPGDPAGLVRKVIRQLVVWREAGAIEALREATRRHVPGAEV